MPVKENPKYEEKINNMSVERAKIELGMLRSSFKSETIGECYPDEDYLDYLVFYSGYIEAHIIDKQGYL